MIGTSFPKASEISAPYTDFPRHEWLFYKHFIENTSSKLRMPCYGDYAIEIPEFRQGDMRLIKPAAKVIYTTGDIWHIRKGTAFRDNPQQQHQHCESVLNSGHFQGQDYSAGDEHIARCAAKVPKSHGNLTVWKWVATNHHITHVVEDVSNYFSPT